MGLMVIPVTVVMATLDMGAIPAMVVMATLLMVAIPAMVVMAILDMVAIPADWDGNTLNHIKPSFQRAFYCRASIKLF